MKDAPAVLVAYLSVVAPELAEQIFDRVIDDAKMLRNFVQVVRSGQLARRSLASMPKRLVRRWLARRSDEQLFRASVGQQPSLADVIKLAHPKPDSAARSALYGYLCGRTYDAAALPPIVITASEAHRLSALADSSMAVFPRVAQFLARETDRAQVVADDADLHDVVRMGSRVRYRDDETGDVREVVLVYPHEADIALRRISVLTPVGAALIGLSVGQTIDFQTPSHQTRSVTILAVTHQD
jgi:regulator of nucleoside diphosphate kinase